MGLPPSSTDRVLGSSRTAEEKNYKRSRCRLDESDDELAVLFYCHQVGIVLPYLSTNGRMDVQLRIANNISITMGKEVAMRRYSVGHDAYSGTASVLNRESVFNSDLLLRSNIFALDANWPNKHVIILVPK